MSMAKKRDLAKTGITLGAITLGGYAIYKYFFEHGTGLRAPTQEELAEAETHRVDVSQDVIVQPAAPAKTVLPAPPSEPSGTSKPFTDPISGQTMTYTEFTQTYTKQDLVEAQQAGKTSAPLMEISKIIGIPPIELQKMLKDKPTTTGGSSAAKPLNVAVPTSPLKIDTTPIGTDLPTIDPLNYYIVYSAKSGSSSIPDMARTTRPGWSKYDLSKCKTKTKTLTMYVPTGAAATFANAFTPVSNAYNYDKCIVEEYWITDPSMPAGMDVWNKVGQKEISRTHVGPPTAKPATTSTKSTSTDTKPMIIPDRYVTPAGEVYHSERGL